MDVIGQLELIQGSKDYARVELTSGRVIVGDPFCREENIGENEEEDGYTLKNLETGMYEGYFESQIKSVERIKPPIPRLMRETRDTI